MQKRRREEYVGITGQRAQAGESGHGLEQAEHGLGAEPSIGRRFRVHPVTDVLRHLFSSANQGGTASIFVALGFFPRAIFHF